MQHTADGYYDIYSPWCMLHRVLVKEKQMVESVLEVHDELDKQAAKLRYLAEVEDKAGLSELLLDIASRISIVKYAECLKLKEEDEDGTTD